MKPERIETKELVGDLEWAADVLRTKGYPVSADNVSEAVSRLLELEKDRERLDWLEELDPDSRLWFKVQDAICIRTTIDAAMEETK